MAGKFIKLTEFIMILFQSIPTTPVSGLKRNLIDEMNSAGDRSSIRNSPRGMATSLEGGLDDVDLLTIGQLSPSAERGYGRQTTRSI